MRPSLPTPPPVVRVPSFIAVTPIYPNGVPPDLTMGMILNLMDTSLIGPKFPHQELQQTMGPLRFAPSSYRVAADNLELINYPNNSVVGGQLIWSDSHPALENVVPIQDAISDPCLANNAKHFLVPGEPGLWLSALEFSMAETADRPIMGGVISPEPSEIEAFHANEKRTRRGDGLYKNPLVDLYYKPKFFERSGRLYRWLGIKYFQKGVQLLGKGMYYGAAGLYYGLMKLIERDKAPSFGEIVKDLETRMSTGKGGNKYFLGSIRTLDTLQDFSVATRRNEGAHALGTFIPLPFMIKMLPFLLTHPETAIPTYIIYLLNAYATFLQRYNRARVENTIDLKLGRGPFKLDITTADTTDDKPTP